MKDEILERFDSVYLHDLEVISLNLDFENKSLEVIFEAYESEEKISYRFENISKFNTDIPQDHEFINDGILNAECSKNTTHYEAKLVFDMTDTVWWLTVSFSHLIVARK